MIKEEMIFIGVDLESKEEIISFVADKAKEIGVVSNAKEYALAVYKREAEISTSVGHSIAIPHGKTYAVNEAFIAYVRTIKKFQWDSDTKDQVHSVFMIGVPCTDDSDKTHLRYISQVSKKLIDNTFREQLFSCKERGQAYRLLSLINKEL